MAKIKVYLQAFLLFFIPMAILVMIIFLVFPIISILRFSGDFGRSLSTLPDGLVFSYSLLYLTPVFIMSALFSLIIGTLHILFVHQVLKTSGDSYANIYGTKQDKTFSLSISKEQAFSTCLDIFNSLSNFEIKEQNEEIGQIKCRSGSSWKSFGEVVTINIEENDNQALVHIQSKPALFTTIADYGKNLSNIILIEKELRNRIH